MSGTLSIATRALLMAQRALEVTSHNMANVNTEGFSRQKLELTTALPYPTAVGEIGTGVDAKTITRTFDAALNRNLIQKTGILAKYEAEKSSISQIEIIFNESYDSGLNKVMSEFWNAWQEVANNPEGSAERISLVEKSQSLVNIITTMRSYLDDQRTELNDSILNTTKEINIIAVQLADLNAAITKAESDYHNANDLRDSRNLLLRNLSEIIDINHFEDPRDGSVYVLTPKGFPLVEEYKAWSVGTRLDSAGDLQVIWNNESGAQVNITETLTNGKLGGLIEMRDSIITKFYTQFDEFASTLIRKVNGQHAQGAGLNQLTDIWGSYEVSPFAKLETNFTESDNDIIFTAKNTGLPGEQITITLVDPNTINQSLTASVTGNAITITLGTNVIGDIDTTAREIADFITSDSSAGAVAARALISVNVTADDNGYGRVEAMATTYLNRHLSNLLTFGDDMTSGSFDLITYDSGNTAIFNTINVNPTDTVEDIIAQIGSSYLTGVQGVRASIFTDSISKEHLRIEADVTNGYSFAFANDTASALMALGLNTFFTGANSSDLGLNRNVVNNYSLIAAGKLDSTGQLPVGNNVNALEMADIKDTAFTFQIGSVTISEAYNSLAADIGSTAHTIYRNVDFNENLIHLIELRRDAISAVSLDEELTDVIRFQYAYMAAAKLVTVSDSMLESLITMV